MAIEWNNREFQDTRGDLDVRSVGPFERFPVVVNGWTVPGLQAQYENDDGVYLTLDNRFGLTIPTDNAGQIIDFIANAMAVASGWACHPRQGDEPPPPRLPWVRMSGLG